MLAAAGGVIGASRLRRSSQTFRDLAAGDTGETYRRPAVLAGPGILVFACLRNVEGAPRRLRLWQRGRSRRCGPCGAAPDGTYRGDRRPVGMTAFGSDGLDHDRMTSASPIFSKYSTRMVAGTLACSMIVPVSSRTAWGFQSSMMGASLTHIRTPSSTRM